MKRIKVLGEGKKKKILVRNSTPGKTFFSETERDGWRILSPYNSKFGAAIMKGLSENVIQEGDKVLYLGASHGYTVSFVSDIVGDKGLIYAVEFAPEVAKELVFLSEQRKNIAPILVDANQPKNYPEIGKVDVIYQDLAQKNQAEILIKNLKFLKEDGIVLFAAKARSIDVTMQPSKVFKGLETILKDSFSGLKVLILDPYEKDHAFYMGKSKHLK
jgi:fibrillarin-like pre-rRNA processing protein